MEIIEFFIIKQIKKPRPLKKRGKTLDCISCFPLHFFRALPLPACFTTEQSTVEASLFVKKNIFEEEKKFDSGTRFLFGK